MNVLVGWSRGRKIRRLGTWRSGGEARGWAYGMKTKCEDLSIAY